MKVTAFAASNSKTSINKALVTHAAQLLKSDVHPGAEVEILDLNDFPVPIYSVDIEGESGVPENAKSFFEKIGQSDALLISYAEHNGSYTAAWKSLFDWMSRIEMKVFQDKPMVILSTSPGRGGAANVLKIATDSAGHFGANILASLSVPSFNHTFDMETGKLTDEDLATKLKETVAALRVN